MNKLLAVRKVKLKPKTTIPENEKNDWSSPFWKKLEIWGTWIITLIVLKRRRATASLMIPSPKIIEWSLGKSRSLMILSTETVSVAVKVAANKKPIFNPKSTFTFQHATVEVKHFCEHKYEREEASKHEERPKGPKEENVVEIFDKNPLLYIFCCKHYYRGKYIVKEYLRFDIYRLIVDLQS